MSVLSRQVTAVSQELQDLTRLLKPLFHNPSSLLVPSAVTPPPSVSSHSCSPAPPLLTQHAPVDYPGERSPPSILVPEPSSPQPSVAEALQGDPFQCAPVTSRYPPVCHCSAPPSLNSSPHEHTVVPHPSSSILSVSSSNHPSSITPLLVDLSGPDGEQPQSRLPLLSHFIPRSHPHSVSQPQLRPLFQPSGMTSRPREALLNQVEWGEHTAQLSFINEAQPSV